MLVTNKNPQVKKEHIVSFIVFDFLEGVTIIDWLEKKIYVSGIEELYTYTIISHLVDSGAAYLLLQIVLCWREFAVDE